MSAIFLMVTLAALGAFMLSFVTVQHSTSALDVEGARASWAAKSGVQRGHYHVQQTTGWCNCPGGTCAGTEVSGSAIVESIPVGNFTVTIGCTYIPVLEAGKAKRIVHITANACNQPTNNGTCPNANPTSAMYVNRAEFGTAQREEP
ncbi:agglutinin biogenesis protein MshP [Noviherbaspirillum sp. ST9]|uniref:agglutinin biogenesis protein MshP n=1 Tax=Noviherbaspirillum sp. ST9 TaxID=3401606 RepID=UPI003B58801D